MAQPNQNSQATLNKLDVPDRKPEYAAATADSSDPLPLTHEQANQILAEMKGIKQNIFLLLLVLGFFAARSLLFHY